MCCGSCALGRLRLRDWCFILRCTNGDPCFRRCFNRVDTLLCDGANRADVPPLFHIPQEVVLIAGFGRKTTSITILKQKITNFNIVNTAHSYYSILL